MSDQSQLWPVRIKPLPDELLSSWLVRLAHGHGLKVQSFCHLIVGDEHQVWNRDIDRLAPNWLIEELSSGTGLPITTALETTLRAYEGVFYPKFQPAGHLSWILTQKMYHRKRNGYGLQFCPRCLSLDAVPFFRKRWRIALNTVCHEHQVALLDRCPNCGQAIALHRLDMRDVALSKKLMLSFCATCGEDLSRVVAPTTLIYADDAGQLLAKFARKLEGHDPLWSRLDIEELAVLRHLTALMTSRYKHDHLREYVVEQLHVDDLPVSFGYVSIEALPWHERHHLVQLAAWLLADLEHRLTNAWKDGAIRYNLLLKGFDSPPGWYSQIVDQLSNWRKR